MRVAAAGEANRMSAASELPPPEGRNVPSDTAQRLRALYDTSLGPYLQAQDAEVLSTRRNRWLILFGGLALAGGIMFLVVRSGSQGEIVPAIAFGIAVVSIGLFAIMKGALADMVRDHVMAEIAPILGLRFDRTPKDPAIERFELLGLAHCSTILCHDRLSGEFGGLAVDMMTAKLTETSSSGAGSDAQTHTTVRFTGVLMRIDDPAPPAVRFRLIPPARLSPHGMLRGMSTTIHGEAGQPPPSRAQLLAMLAATPEEAPVTPTGDATFDARFELHASAPDVAAALVRLDAGTRSALLDIADLFVGAAAAVGFDAGGILLAFVTKQRFEIGPLRPPMAQFERVRHLADQMGVVSMITERIRTARDEAASPRPAT